jgi:hypothetical protein
MTSSKIHKPSYNHIWAIGYGYAMNTGMNVHRAEQFAADYAQFHDGQWMTEIAHPADFVSFAIALDYHYHG